MEVVVNGNLYRTPEVREAHAHAHAHAHALLFSSSAPEYDQEGGQVNAGYARPYSVWAKSLNRKYLQYLC